MQVKANTTHEIITNVDAADTSGGWHLFAPVYITVAIVRHRRKETRSMMPKATPPLTIMSSVSLPPLPVMNAGTNKQARKKGATNNEPMAMSMLARD